MKILYVSPHLSTGGLPQFLLKKIECLKDYAQIYCVEYSNHGGFVVQRNQIKNLLSSNFIELGDDKKAIIKIIKDIKPDVVHFEEMPEYFMDMNLAKEIYAKDREYLIFETSHDSSFNSNAKRVFPDKFTFVSEFQKRNVENLGIPSEVHEYPITLNIKKPREEALKVLGLDPEKKHVVNVGLFTPRKNQAEIVQYAKKLKDYPIQFHFVGNHADNFRFYWEPIMKEFPSNCFWWNERKDVENFYQAADLFLFTSRGDENNKETSPLVIREAISFNLPSLIYNLPVYLGMYDKYDNVDYLNFNDLNENCQKILEKLNLQKAEDKKTYNDLAFIISCYPSSTETANITKKCLEALAQFNAPKILASHCDVPLDVQNLANYTIVDKERNIMTNQSYYTRYWQQLWRYDANYRATLFLDTSLNDTYHGPAVYTNYYNGTSLARSLGYKKAICLNFDFIFKDSLFFDKVYEGLKNSDGYFVKQKEPEGMVVKTVFYATDTDFFMRNFPLIKNEEDYKKWRLDISSESNGLENMYFHTIKEKLKNSTVSEFQQYEKDTSMCEKDSNSQVEYFSLLPIKEQSDKICIFFCSSNSNDSRRIEIQYPNGLIKSDINGKTTIMEFIDKPQGECFITAKVFDVNQSPDVPIYTRNIVVDEEYIKNKMPKNGIVERV